MKSRTGFFALGVLAGLLLGASLTAKAAGDLDRYAERSAHALERIATALEKR
jgi:hypothetical protein